MRKQRSASRELPFQWLPDQLNRDRDEHQIALAGEMFRRGLAHLSRRREVNKPVGDVNRRARERAGLDGACPHRGGKNLVDRVGRRLHAVLIMTGIRCVCVPSIADAFARALRHRSTLISSPDTTAYRLFDGAGDNVPGVYVDRLGPAAILSVYDDARWPDVTVSEAANLILDATRDVGVASVYVKRFIKDRSRLGGRPPAESTSATPRAGVAQPEALTVAEHGVEFEVRPYDGFSTGLFLEHREHRRALAERGVKRALNLFAYTCAFSVPLAAAGAHVTNVDVSARYLDWGRRNHALNGLDAAQVRYARMDAMAYLAYAARHAHERFDLIVLDPPTFGAGNSRRGIKPWKATSDYPKLIAAAAGVLTAGGRIFAGTNARELATDGALKAMIEDAVGKVRWESLPPWPKDVRERGRVAAALFTPR
jgi:23S rRNA (cytosine1962-C5)-methyltransferase